MIAREDLLAVKRIASRANPRVKDWAGLADRKNREALRLTFVEGAKLVAEALDLPEGGSRFEPVGLLVSDSGAERPEAGRLFDRAGERGVERFYLSDDCFDKISALKNSDGLAVLLSFTSAEPDFKQLFTPSDARWLIAAGVQDPGNAGALTRTALAAGCGGCIFLDGADPLSPKFLRGSMGAALRIPCLAMSTEDFVAAWPTVDAKLYVAVSGDGAARYYREMDFLPPMALLVGGERGIPGELAALSDLHAHIPLRGDVESLNLAVAAGIILFEAERRWRDAGL